MKAKVLIADEFATIRNIVVQGLKRNFEDITVEEAKNGKEAQEMMIKNRYDLIICDWELPVMNGEELLKWIRNHRGIDETPFIMLTPRSEKEYVMKAVSTGVDSYLIKPFTIAGLIQKVLATADNFNRRKLERYEIESPIMVRFGTHSMTGKLIDIGLGGLLSIFKRDSAQPVIFDTVSFNMELDQDMAFADMEGFIIRIQADEARLDSKYIKYAIKFMNVNAETESRLLKYLKKIYPHQW